MNTVEPGTLVKANLIFIMNLMECLQARDVRRKSLDSLLDKTFENKPVSLKVNKLSKNILISCNLRGNYGSEVVSVLAVCWQLGIALQRAEVKLGVKSNGKCSLQPLSVFFMLYACFFVDLFVFHTSPIPGELSC